MPLSDIVSCPTDRLEEAITREEPYSLGSWYLAKGIGSIELCKLGEVLGLGSYDGLKAQFQLVGEPLDEGPWPETIHEGLIAAVRSLSDGDIAKIAPIWAEIDELQGATTPDILATYLKGVRDFLVANRGPFFLVNAL